jgi:hypothetical protein
MNQEKYNILLNCEGIIAGDGSLIVILLCKRLLEIKRVTWGESPMLAPQTLHS